MVKTASLTSLLAACFLFAATEAKEYHTKVAILGGGVSGISAALNLTAAGVDEFMMIEAREILGGRAQDVPFAGINVELGCNWVEGLGTNPINKLAIKYKLKTAFSNSDDVVWYSKDGKYNGTETINRLNDAYEKLMTLGLNKLKKDEADINVRAGLDMSGWFPKNALDNAAEYFMWDWEYAETPELSSSIYGAVSNAWLSQGFGPDSDGNNFVLDPRGFKHIFLEEAKKVFKPNDKRLLLNTIVNKIDYTKNGVTIHTTKGDTIHADYAITTFSLGVLQHKDVEWSPALPNWKLEGIYGFHMATYTKIFMNFPHQFWDDSQFTVWADPNRRGRYSSFQNLNAPGFLPKNTSTNIFFVTVTQDMAYYVESLTDDQVKDEIMGVLRQMYGKDIPEPTEFKFPRWHSNPLFRGTFSNWPIGELDEQHQNYRAPIHNRVFFAGEATSAEYFGYLQGAWITGGEVGTQVAQCVKGRCPRATYYPEVVNAKMRANLVRRRLLENI